MRIQWNRVGLEIEVLLIDDLAWITQGRLPRRMQVLSISLRFTFYQFPFLDFDFISRSTIDNDERKSKLFIEEYRILCRVGSSR